MRTNIADRIRDEISRTKAHGAEMRAKGQKSAGGWENLRAWHAYLLEEAAAERRILAKCRARGLRDDTSGLELTWALLTMAKTFPMPGTWEVLP